MSGFNNPIIGGGGGLVYPSIHSPNFVTGVSGWTIKKDGSAEFNNLKIRGTFLGSTFELSSNGFFLYNGVPGVGNIPIAGISTGTTDDYGNLFITGNMVTGGSMFFRNAANAFAQLALFNSQPGLVNGTGDANEQHPAFHNTFVSGAGGTRQEVTVVQSGDFDVSGVLNSIINLISASQDGTSKRPEIKLVTGGATLLDILGPVGVSQGSLTFGGVPGQQMKWTDSNSQLNFDLAGSGPFITGEQFHALSQPANTTNLISTPSSCSGRIKLLPWNMVQLEIQFTINAGNVNTTFTLGAPPSISYAPVDDRRFACSCTAAVDARLFVPASGAGPQVIISAAAATASVGAAVMFANN